MSTCILIGQQDYLLYFHSTMMHENDRSNMIVTICSFTKKLKLCIYHISINVKSENINFIKEIQHVLCFHSLVKTSFQLHLWVSLICLMNSPKCSLQIFTRLWWYKKNLFNVSFKFSLLSSLPWHLKSQNHWLRHIR